MLSSWVQLNKSSSIAVNVVSGRILPAVLAHTFVCSYILSCGANILPAEINTEVCLQKHKCYVKERRISYAAFSMGYTIKKHSENELVLAWRCPMKDCQKRSSIKSTNSFFTFQDCLGRASSKLDLHNIYLLVSAWKYSNCTIEQLWYKLFMLIKLLWTTLVAIDTRPGVEYGPSVHY